MIQQIIRLETQKVLDLCSGIGGFTLGNLISGGFETVAFCEINSYCQQVLNLRFPQIPIIPDIHDITVKSLAGIGVREVDGIIAGLPCPPFSLAGKQKASLDERNLFGEFFRVLRCVRPDWAIVENVPGLLTAEGSEFFRAVLWQFAEMGFDVQWGVFSAASVGAVHKRERVWIIAHSQSPRRGTSWSQYTQSGTNIASVGGGDDGDSQKHRLTNSVYPLGSRRVEYTAFALGRAAGIAESASNRGDDRRTTGLDKCLLTHPGLDSWLTSATVPSFNRLSRNEIAALPADSQKEYCQLYAEYQSLRRQHAEQIKALGNAIVPQCAALIFERLKTILSQQEKNP
ncbi:cytosine-specific methyltransferase [Nostoc commune NIES-4072]|uniref:Cytosine-specific methyltransferase n=1 Tax=Nostoc commune NIES-4072 TaxID=2005467 RepID=A0A2R5G0W6_NOSCO|nr:DNA cytosine methyltransferase [Nostoc commune]BBD70703.1 cytosine-specific methyltransferase [Nostoc commune HK-02]GBG23358.1 cytosine-specific methyltransferase [Nostoc commune NIES-4072]